MAKKKSYSLRTTVAVMVSAVVILVLLVLYFIFRNQIIPQTRHALEDKAITIARTIALMPLLSEGLSEGRSKEIQAYTSKITRRNDILFVVVLDMNSIRYSHPDPAKVGQPFVGGGQETALRGRESISEGTGTLGNSLRAFVPVYDGRGHQLGVVVAGLSMERVERLVRQNEWTIILILISGALLGAGGAYVLARRIKQMIFGMEPADILRLLQERSAMLESTREGIITIDQEARITIINKEAHRLLKAAGISGAAVNRQLADYWPELDLAEVLVSGEARQDQELELGGISLLVSSLPVLVDGEIAGAITTFRDKTELAVLAERLSGISVYADALRAGAHEFMNKLHVIMGMTHMGLYDELQQYILGTAGDYQKEIGAITRAIKDPVMAGFLLGKLSRAREAGIELLLAGDSYLPEPADPQVSHELITIAGNLLDNAMEALSASNKPGRAAGAGSRQVMLAFRYEAGRLLCEVSDKGPGIPAALQEQIFAQGFSTKGEQRGIGLYLVRKSVDKLQGRLELAPGSGAGTRFTVDVPYAAKEGESL
ncbi:DcuS/MalK family sensor histidine kinase [Paenibacillus sp. MMS20-IR301]|uniref:DcuS/MalK family sensor histidine kinase n=1 Tax=Paenibacillus sp. MMS20-IR301 TaxID=2895946 RepID=UPI0028ECA1EA|nr:DcuS/MalK family sensor histidine kinase [Paenibacillus sp. MMS20-IR301]WNS46591.1 DcuS/MalK family sensor histidine kinase [Paenibacillus sp. MMS20-IR301]